MCQSVSPLNYWCWRKLNCSVVYSTGLLQYSHYIHLFCFFICSTHLKVLFKNVILLFVPHLKVVPLLLVRLNHMYISYLPESKNKTPSQKCVLTKWKEIWTKTRGNCSAIISHIATRPVIIFNSHFLTVKSSEGLYQKFSLQQVLWALPSTLSSFHLENQIGLRPQKCVIQLLYSRSVELWVFKFAICLQIN